MAPKKISLFDEIRNEKEFQNTLDKYERRLICAEIYSHFTGSCTAMDRFFTTVKFDWSDGKMIFLKVPADDIQEMKRFRNQSEPVYMLILNKKATRVIRGTNSIKLSQVIRKELDYIKKEESGMKLEREMFQIEEPTPEEMDWINVREVEERIEIFNQKAKKEARQAARKRHRAELMVPHLLHLNFLLYWPHAKHAHPDVYERLDINNIIMIGREELLLTKEKAEDILYEGDAPVNEASLHQLTSAPVLAICFRLLDTEKHFVSLVRSILYEEPARDGNTALKEDESRRSAFDLYKTYSPTREEVLQRRLEDRQRRKEEEHEKRARRLSEMQRLARQAIEEAIETRQKEIERKKLDLLKSGNLEDLSKINEKIKEDLSIVIPHDWINVREVEERIEIFNQKAKKEARQAARKRHRAELMVPHLLHLNFLLYWPHAKHAHPDVYERLDINNIIMIGREELLLTKEKAEDILYEGDAPVNEASLHQLTSAPVLAICFRLLDTEKHFVSLVRSILYEEPARDGNTALKEDESRRSAFDLYKTYSPTREEVLQRRLEDRQRRKEEEHEKRARRLSEMQRLARQAIEEAIETRQKEIERKKLDLLKSGNLEDLSKINEEIKEDLSIVIPHELPEEMEEESSEEDEDEYLPPPGLSIPGFYAPPSDIAKANGLAILFPKLVSDLVKPQPEFLPPHVLVMLSVSQRYTAVKVLRKFKTAIIHMGIFRATGPYDAVHVAYSVFQYDRLRNSVDESKLRLVFMLSVESDIALLHLVDLNPLHVSRDSAAGEDECAAIFPIGYADSYPEFEDFCGVALKEY